MGQYLLVQRSGLGGGRRSNSAPPTNQKSGGPYGGTGRGRPSSIGMQQQLHPHPQQQSESQPAMRSLLANQNAQTYYSVPQPYGLMPRVNNGDCTCSRKAMAHIFMNFEFRVALFVGVPRRSSMGAEARALG
ncbi:hypothetical protein ACFE04_008297 [Oxalis oulophora]